MKTFNDLIGQCKSIYPHTALLYETNPIVKDIEKLSLQDLRTVIQNYSGFSNFAIHCLLDAAIRTFEWKLLQKEVIRNIEEELGSSTDGVPHLAMMRYGYLKDLKIETDRIFYRPHTEQFFFELKSIFNQNNTAKLAGALCAFESTAIPEFHIMDAVIQKFLTKQEKTLNPESQTALYIQGHKQFELEHEQGLLDVCALYILTPEQQEDFQQGFESVVEALSCWWRSMHFSIT